VAVQEPTGSQTWIAPYASAARAVNRENRCPAVRDRNAAISNDAATATRNDADRNADSLASSPHASGESTIAATVHCAADAEW
jgi:hypothetical protein